eukprot:Skav210993  [mRNA]  locus=scaffold2325:48284:52735:- [translate_table: standard]
MTQEVLGDVALGHGILQFAHVQEARAQARGRQGGGVQAPHAQQVESIGQEGALNLLVQGRLRLHAGA